MLNGKNIKDLEKDEKNQVKFENNMTSLMKTKQEFEPNTLFDAKLALRHKVWRVNKAQLRKIFDKIADGMSFK